MRSADAGTLRSIRQALKRLAELGLLHGGPAAAARRRVRSGALILAYHNILPHGESGGADASLHLPQEEFARQLDCVAEHCRVAPLKDLMIETKRAEGPTVAITFDDGYIGAFTAGVEELARRRLPATFFVPPGCLGGSAFWWDSFVEHDGGALRPATRTYLVETLAGRNDTIQAWAADHLRRVTVPPAARTCSVDHLRVAAQVSGISIGAHSWSHPNLARLDPALLGQELRMPLDWLVDRFGSAEPVLALPYGRHSTSVLEALPSTGYRAALAISGGWILREAALDRVLPRMNVSSGLSGPGFALRIAGLLS